MRGSRWADDEAAFESMRRKVPQSVGECFALIERAHFLGPWVMGAEYSLADGYLFTLAQWMEADGVDPAGLPVIAEHRHRMRERPAVERALAAERGER
jgi:glutathione S-transferase